ncbi:MAG: fluoride efflux transporter CrcB [Thermoleophilaceae bacterium]
MVIVLLVAVCGGLGAVARFGVDGLVQSRVLGEYPLGTLIVNLSGSALLGLLVGLHASRDVLLVAGTATLGSYTTFSTWMLEAHRAAEDGQPRLAWWSIGVAVAAGLAAAALGRAIGGAL